MLPLMRSRALSDGLRGKKGSPPARRLQREFLPWIARYNIQPLCSRNGAVIHLNGSPDSPAWDGIQFRGDVRQRFPRQNIHRVKLIVETNAELSVRPRNAPLRAVSGSVNALRQLLFIRLRPTGQANGFPRVALNFQPLDITGVIGDHLTVDQPPGISHLHALIDQLGYFLQAVPIQLFRIPEAVVVRRVGRGVADFILPTLRNAHFDRAPPHLKFKDFIASLPLKIKRKLNSL